MRAQTLALLVSMLVALGSWSATPSLASAQAPQAAQSDAPAGYDALIARALQDFGASHWAEARALFEQAHGLFPNARTQRGIGMAAFEMHDFPAAMTAFEAALGDQRRALTEEQHRQVSDLLERARQQVGRYVVPALNPGTALFVDGEPTTIDSSWPAQAAQLLLGAGRHDVSVRDTAGHTSVVHLVVQGGEAGAPLSFDIAGPRRATNAGIGTPSRSDGSSAPLGPRRAPVHHGAAPLILIAAGAAAAVGGVVLFALGRVDLHKVENAASGSEWADLAATNDRIGLFTGVGAALVAVGAAAVVVGVVLRIGESNSDEQLTVGLGPGGVAMRGTW